MKVLLTAHGSRGDVCPMVALGRRLLNDGHDVVMMTQPTHARRVNEAGFEGVFTSEDAMESMASMGSGWKGVKRMLDWSRLSLEEEFSLLEGPSADADLVVSTNQEFSVASVAEWRGIPAFRLSYIPAIPGDHTPPLIPWQNLPVPVNRLIWKAFGTGLDSMAKKTVNRWRTGRGLSDVKSLTPHMTSVFLTLYGFNSRLAPPHPSWNRDAFKYCGYCFEEEGAEPLPGDIEAFLNDGSPPVYLGFGSVTVPDADRMTADAIEAHRSSGARLIISKGWTGLGSDDVLAGFPDLEGQVKVIGDVSHTKLFPRCAGVCHHGGAGTTHRAAHAGVPQFIMPVFADQHFWGDRIYRIGAGAVPLPPAKVTAAKLAEVFTSFVRGSAYAAGAESLRKAVRSDEGTAEAARIILQRMENLRSGAA